MKRKEQKQVNKAGIDFMTAIAHDIVRWRMPKKLAKELAEHFYAFMRKYGITQMTRVDDVSLEGDNFEWTMCKMLFLDALRRDLEWQMMFTETKKEFIKIPEKHNGK